MPGWAARGPGESSLAVPRPDQSAEAIRAENRKLRYLRFLVDLALREIRAGRLSLEEASRVVENVRGQALKLFPGKETAFEVIYRPKFQRAIAETFRLH